MKKALAALAFIMTGFILGLISMGFLSMQAARMYPDIFRVSYDFEQNVLAAQAKKEGQNIWTVVHLKNLVDITSPHGIKSLKQTGEAVGSFVFPLAARVLYKINQPSELTRKGRVYMEGLYRGRLARALESIGMMDEAEIQWEKAIEKVPYNDRERLRAEVEKYEDTMEKGWLKAGAIANKGNESNEDHQG